LKWGGVVVIVEEEGRNERVVRVRTLGVAGVVKVAVVSREGMIGVRRKLGAFVAAAAFVPVTPVRMPGHLLFVAV